MHWTFDTTTFAQGVSPNLAPHRLLFREAQASDPELHDLTWKLIVQEASDKGFFRAGGQPNLKSIIAAAADVAAGMAFLHGRGVVHGDLTGGNVLLATDENSPSGVVAKIADFGLARAMDVKSKIETRTYGTVTHMPPELLEKGIFSKVHILPRSIPAGLLRPEALSFKTTIQELRLPLP